MTTSSELKSKLAREPFRPFVIELGSGGRVAITAETEILLPRSRPELVIAFTSEGLQHEFELSAIQALLE